MQSSIQKENNTEIDFFDYWDSLGFFESLRLVLPTKFFILFEIARTIFTDEETSEALSAIDEITTDEKIYEPDRDESIQVNRVDKIAPVSDKMEIDTYRTINELKKALPRELAQDDDIFNVKLYTKTLIVQKHYESEADRFKPVSTSRDAKGREANKFEQKFYILMDKSNSMELKMRSFYAKCIVAEFLRRKLKSKAKLYYRPFNSNPGDLFKIEKPEDFPLLIERVLLTTTEGRTDIQAAVYQAIKDIQYEKEMLNSEILVVTDGISKIQKGQMKERLGDIKLHVLKIGNEMAEVDFYDMQNVLSNNNNTFDSSSVNIRRVKEEIEQSKENAEETKLNISERRAYQLILDQSEGMFNDLREISTKYIEIKDFEGEGLFEITDESLENIKSAIDQFEKIEAHIDIKEKERRYKQVYFLNQYLQVLMENGHANNSEIKQCMDRIAAIKQKMLKDPELLFTVMETKEFDEDKKAMKLAKKEARKLMKEMEMKNKELSLNDMKRARILFTMDVGEGSMGKFILLLLVMLMKFIKKVLLFPFRPFMKKKEDEAVKMEGDISLNKDE
ncbi:MAG: hypothetical protein GY754_20905 [bacterium]|nr:hypothetical protein [bacterium]